MNMSDDEDDSFRREFKRNIQHPSQREEVNYFVSDTSRISKLNQKDSGDNEKRKQKDDNSRFLNSYSSRSSARTEQQEEEDKDSVLKFVIQKVEDSEQRDGSVSIKGLVSTVAREFNLTGEEKEALIGYFEAMPNKDGFLKLRLLDEKIKENIGVFSVRQAMRIIYDGKIKEALKRVKMSSKVFEEAESFYVEIKEKEESLRQREKGIGAETKEAKRQLAKKAKELGERCEVEWSRKLKELEERIEDLRRDLRSKKNLVPSSRVVCLQSLVSSLKGKTEEQEGTISSLTNRISKMKEKQRKVAIAPNTEEKVERKAKTETADKATETDERRELKWCLGVVGDMVEGGQVETAAYLLMLRVSLNKNKVSETETRDITRSAELGAFLGDSGLFELLVKSAVRDQTFRKFCLKLLLDTTVKRNDLRLISKEPFLSLVVWCTEECLGERNVKGLEQCLILLEKISSFQTEAIRAVVQKVSSAVGQGAAWIGANNTFVLANLNIININLK